MNQLFYAVQQNQPKLVRDYSQLAGQINQQNYTALMLAAQQNKTQILREIRALDLYNYKNKKQPNYIQEMKQQHSQTQETALIMAVKKNFAEAAKILLLEYGLYDNQQLTALAYAIINDSESIVQLLKPCESMCRINGFTILQFCVMNDRPQYFQQFQDQYKLCSLEHSKQQYTALMVASLMGKVQYVNQLAQVEQGVQDSGTKETCLVKILKWLVKIIESNEKQCVIESVQVIKIQQDIINHIIYTTNQDCLLLECKILGQFENEKTLKDNTNRNAQDYVQILKNHQIEVQLQ